MKKYSVSLITKISVLVLTAFLIVLGNEVRIGIQRYIKNTLETDASATKIDLDRFSKSYSETLSLKKVDLYSAQFSKIYQDVTGGNTSKIKCLVDKKGNIIDISREGIKNHPDLGILIDHYNNVDNWPMYLNLSSLNEKELDKLEELLKDNVNRVNNIKVKIICDNMDMNNLNHIENVKVKEIKINDEIVISKDMEGECIEVQGVLHSYENYNLEIYFISSLSDTIKSAPSQYPNNSEPIILDYDDTINGLKKHINHDFKKFISEGKPLTSTNYGDYFLIKPYEYNNKHYSTVLLRLVDWSLLDVKATKSDQEVLDDITVGYILVTQEYNHLTIDAAKQFIWDNFSTFLLTFILIVIMCVIIAYIVVLPIRRIENVAEHIAQKEFNYPIDTSGHDELGDLSRSIDKMRHELEKTIDSLYQEIERVEQLEDVRKDFFSNFTHEIKTPLGIINGFSELIELEKDEAKRNEYIQIIQRETKRINDLVLAMLDLSKVESKKITLSLENIDLLDVVNESIDSFMYLVEKKKIDLQLELNSVEIQADYFKIKMVIDNFISNALRYTEPNKKIKIIVDQNHFSIENEGAHIAQEDLNKVWLTFYKADKARNKEGTGLGLAICKAVLDQHHFHYQVNNTQNGVMFSFDFGDESH